ncbi:isocitrate lyase/phosphoenolpyruvate mutase family protein [Streptosporangium roseum]|uniref:isocitrate lyase/phosphoenolpyruvate mutase family protein n=1 Tax=Streptosporangium roseum TaxID=2001 RepID=UPI00332A096A
MTFERFRALHHGREPLLLPNAWDHASAAALAEAGFAAVATTSLGVAAAAGLPDAEQATWAQTVTLARGIATLGVPVTVDIEGGFGGPPARVADRAAELAAAGVAGVNLEDGRGQGLAEVAEQVALIGAIKQRVPQWGPGSPVEESNRYSYDLRRCCQVPVVSSANSARAWATASG